MVVTVIYKVVRLSRTLMFNLIGEKSEPAISPLQLQTFTSEFIVCYKSRELNCKLHDNLKKIKNLFKQNAFNWNIYMFEYEYNWIFQGLLIWMSHSGSNVQLCYSNQVMFDRDALKGSKCSFNHVTVQTWACMWTCEGHTVHGVVCRGAMWFSKAPDDSSSCCSPLWLPASPNPAGLTLIPHQTPPRHTHFNLQWRILQCDLCLARF